MVTNQIQKKHAYNNAQNRLQTGSLMNGTHYMHCV